MIFIGCGLKFEEIYISVTGCRCIQSYDGGL